MYIFLSVLKRKLGTLDFFATRKIADTEVNAEKTVQIYARKYVL